LKKELLFTLFIFIAAYGYSQPAKYWQQEVNYKIDVSLNDTAKTLDGYISMQYVNNSPDTLRFIWIHLWPNAYKNDRTAFSDQFLENGHKEFYFSNDDKRGYINRLDFKVNKNTAGTEDHPEHQDIIKLFLPKPLAPGANTQIETPFHVKLPYNFSRGGYIGSSFQLTQWYPKPAVYDKYGWHEMPYLDQGEFYSEFGEFDVQITVPKDYILAATGPLKNQADNGDTKTYHYVQKNIHDFAWFADKNFEIKHDTLKLETHTIDVYAYYNKSNEKKWHYIIDAIKTAVKTKSEWIGEYPFDIISVVERPGKEDGSGMEYPTITLVSSSATDLIVHETGHNWFYGILATNEREHPWMDEGMNTYYDRRYMQDRYRNSQQKKSFLQSRISTEMESVLLESIIAEKKDQPIETPSAIFPEFNYNMIAYYKTATWMKLLESSLGKPLFDSVMHEYYARWKFKHPYPEDFKLVAQEVSGRNVDTLFSLLSNKGSIKKRDKKSLKITTFFSFKDASKHHYIFLSPAIGYNYYDKFMVGALIHNYTLPQPKLKFIFAPLYATNSKQFNGIGNVSYNSVSEKKINKFIIGLTGERFSSRQSLDTSGKKMFEGFYKIVPYVKLYFSQPARSHTLKWIDVRSYQIGEKRFDPNSYKQIAGSDSTVYYPQGTVSSSRYINQLSYNVENTRTLYPYNYQLKLQQGKGFYRLDVNADYFFNYTKGGGMKVRLFASKFGYIGEKNYSNYGYWPKLLAATGDDDYTYSNYFIGRTASTTNPEQPVKNLGMGAQQVMIRDGGLKLRLDQFDFLQGRSDKWVAALNFNTTLPSVFPPKLPLKLFFDIGTNAETWKEDSQVSRFLYVGGLQLSLFKNVLNIYAPLIYSKDFKTQLKTIPERNSFGKRITFSIDLQHISFPKFFPQIPL
jgi:hypothetical protein